ncbi:MAG: PP2C family serine/threonine-protein phosphatase [Hyphomicrobiaceae bacterium]
MNWHYAAASVAGTSHAGGGSGCQDAHHCAVVADAGGRNVFVAVVSDGAGSAMRGGEGASITCNAIMEQVSASLASSRVQDIERETALSWLDGVREHIAHVAGLAHLEMRDYAATLLLAVVDEQRAVFGQIGDGAIVTLNGPGEWDAQFWPQRGMYANQTFFVTDEFAHDRMTFGHSLYPVRELALFSDGLERVLLNHAERRAHSPVFEKMLQPLRQIAGPGHAAELSMALSRYLASTSVTARTDDDVTLVIATRS